jgi:XTP/dITP diphosphohydrolase
MSKLILATNNVHKISEISDILAGVGIEILSARDLPDFPHIDEVGETLEENALIKARAVWHRYRLPAVADDTGLEVDYLDGAPGVYSARFAGPGCSYDDNNRKLLGLLERVPLEKRIAKFKTIIAFIDRAGREYAVEGTLEGRIATIPAGDNGFGYDPIFFAIEAGRTLAELPAAEKNRISHRSRALAEIRPILIHSLSGIDT